MKTLPAILLSALLLAAPCRPGAQDAPARAVPAEDAAQVRDRLAVSLFFRGELADKIIEAGMADRFVSLEGAETHAEARMRLLEWIRRNPGKAAEVYLGLKGSGGRLHDSIETRKTVWEFNPAFIASIKALNTAAGNSSVSREAMELAARRLYDGPQAEAADAVELGSGAGGGGGTNFFSGGYADYRLNRAGLERETARAGAWLEAVKPSGPGSPANGAYGAAFALYREFLVAAAALKGREAMTGAESLRLEDLRARLRSALAALTFSARAEALREAASSLEPFRGEPGAAQLAAALRALAEKLETSAAGAGQDLRALAAAVNGGERDFASLYLVYTAYDGLLSLKRRSAPGFSCLLDLAAYRYLAAYFPASPYPAARARLEAAGRLDGALGGLGAGDLEGALSGLDPAVLEAAAAAAASASALNRASQFFSWGLLFRPVELKVLPGPRGPVFKPAFTFFELVGKR
jgi:hypothetical protein